VADLDDGGDAGRRDNELHGVGVGEGVKGMQHFVEGEDREDLRDVFFDIHKVKYPSNLDDHCPWLGPGPKTPFCPLTPKSYFRPIEITLLYVSNLLS
jgi:hypothetical protein